MGKVERGSGLKCAYDEKHKETQKQGGRGENGKTFREEKDRSTCLRLYAYSQILCSRGGEGPSPRTGHGSRGKIRVAGNSGGGR